MKQLEQLERRDLIRIGVEGEWCVVVGTGRDKIANFSATACGDRVHVTAIGRDIVYEAPLLPAPPIGSGLREVCCPFKTALGVRLTSAHLCAACAFAINPAELGDKQPKESTMTQNLTTPTLPGPASYQLTPLRSVAESKTNPRKTFVGIQELAESERKHGIIVPLLVRPHPKAKGEVAWELVAGARRLRAAHVAKLVEVPILIRELTDLDVLEIQVIENVQRADVHPLEEADGYEMLIEKHGYDRETIAAKIGKSVSYVHARVKLCALGEKPRAAFLDGRLTASVALLLARVPDLKSQDEALPGLLGEAEWRDMQGAGIRGETIEEPDREHVGAGEDPDEKPIPLSYRAAARYLQRKFMLRLELAKFPTGDQTLVPAAGSCLACEFRTGNQQDLFEDVASADVCTKPTCFETKTSAFWDRTAAAAKDAGVKVIAGKEAEKQRLFGYGGEVSRSAALIDPKEKVPWDLLSPGAKDVTWQKLLPKNAKLPRTIVQDPDGAPRELVDKAAAVKLLREAGKIDKPERPSPASSGDEAWKRKQKKEKEEREAKKRTFLKVLAIVADTASEGIAKSKENAFWRWIAAVGLLEGNGGYEDLDFVRERRSLGEDGDLEKLLEKMNGDAARGLFAECAMARLHDAAMGNFGVRSAEKLLEAGCVVFGITWKGLLADTKDSMKKAAAAEAQIAAAKKKPAKKGGRK